MKKTILFIAIGIALTTQTLLAQVPSYVPSNGLVGYWPFNGNANDQTPNGNNGTVNGATLTTDRFGNTNNAYNFNGLSNYIDLNKQLPNTFSISLWVMVDVFKSYSGVNHDNIGSNIIGTFNNNFEFSGFACGTSGVPSSFGQHGASFWNPNPNNVSVTSSNNLVINEWKNLIMTYDGVSLKYYVNGIQEGSSNAIFTQNNRNLFVGAREFHLNGPDFFFDGKIDDIGIWNRALTQQEITSMYNGVTYSDTCNAVSGSLVNGLVAYYPFCGNANDDSGNGNNGTVNGATLTTDRFGNTNSAYFFDGLNDEIRANVNITQNITVSCWVKSQFTANDFPTFFNFYSSLSNYPWVFYAQASYNTNIGSRYVTLNSSSSPIFSDNVSNVLSLNNWQFVTIVVDSTMNKHKLFVNGILINENTFQGLHQFADKIMFGSQGPGQLTNFYGSLDDIGIWNRALTQQEITQLFNQNQCITNITVTDTLIINVGQLSFTNPVAYANNITIYPNPASTQINISFNNITDLNGGTIKVINSLGQQVATTPITTTGTNSTMLLSTWGGSGLYFVQILNPQGQIVDIKKILLQ
jgi:hypothetical protein